MTRFTNFVIRLRKVLMVGGVNLVGIVTALGLAEGAVAIPPIRRP